MAKTIFSSTIIIAVLFILFSCHNNESRENDIKAKKSYSDAEPPAAAPAEEQALAPETPVLNESEQQYNVTVADVNGSMASGAVSNSMAATGNKNGFISSSAAVANKDTSKKFIRTADIKFRVNNVLQSTLIIEDITKYFEGFVTYTHLASEINNHVVTPVSLDSALETIYYTVSNHMVVRVPNTKLDTALRSIAKQIDFLDYRTIKAEDVTLSLIANRLTQLRLRGHNERLTRAIDERGRKLNETTEAEENLLNKKEQADNTTISTLGVMDKIEFSTITIDIYQKKTVKRSLIENYKNTKEYEPGFFAQVAEAIYTGWYFLKTVVVAIINIWPIILIGILGWFIFRRHLRK